MLNSVRTYRITSAFCCTPLIQNATQIRWLAISLLFRVRPITSTDADSLSPAEVDSLKSEVEFENLLHHVLPPETSSVVLEEIISLHSKVLHAGRAKSGVSCLSAESYTCLRECLLTDPVGANSIVQQLLCLWCPHFSETDNQLQDLYKEVLWLCIQGIEISAQGAASIEREKYQNILLCLVSVLQVSEEKQPSLSEWLATRLLSLCESELVPPQLVYLVLVSRGKLGFLRALIGLENDRRDRGYQGHNVAVMERLCSRLVGESCTEELFYRVSWCSEIVICGKLEIVQTLLSGPGLSVLWPVVLLHTYNQFANREQIFDSLNFLIAQCKSSMALQDVTVALEREITLVQWCKRNNPSLTLDNRHLLELAKRHSTLETLRQTCNLATLPWTDVRSLLDTQGGSAPDSTTSNWDVVTFDGFCILILGFNIILSASEIENLSKKILRSREWPQKCNELINLMNPIISARFTHIDPAVNEQSTQDMSREDKGFSPTQKMYSEQVTKKLQTMKEMICKLFPLTYRIEVLENLFSLLFLRHEHFHSDSSSDSGGENEEADTVRKSLEVSPQDSNSTQPKTSNQDSLLTMDHLKNFEDLNVFFPLNEIPIIKSQVPCSVPISDLNIMASSTCQKVADTKSDTRLASQPSASEMSNPSSENMSSLSSSFLSSMNPSTELRGGVQEEIPTRNSLRDQPNTLIDSKRRPRRVRRTRVRNSSGVSDSSVSSSNDGFVCNKYVVRDWLHCLKECLVNSSVAFYNSRTQQDYADKMTHVPSSVSLDTLQHRMNRLSQYTSEASWRLQLLTDPRFIGEVGQVPEWGLLPETEQSPWIYLSESTASDGDDESPRDTMPCNKRAPRRKGQSDTDKSSSSSSRSISAVELKTSSALANYATEGGPLQLPRGKEAKADHNESLFLQHAITSST
uniref:Uncharacterized protein n=1 Tax=Timema douglasi TaxID=61478 RepID=A0A7R8Z6K1_TIMDO|nr:unnamed protein product [Timema douglasi]